MKKTALFLTAIFFSLFLGNAFSQDMPANKPEIVKKVMTLEGTWEGNLAQKMGDQVSSLTDKISFQSTAGGHGLLVTESMETPDHKQYAGTHLIGYDPVSKQLHWFLIDNMGGCVDNLGQLIGPNHLRLTSESTTEGKTTRGVVNLKWQNQDWIKFDFILTVNGQVRENTQGDFKRTGDMH
jgi:hypothetical protein